VTDGSPCVKSAIGRRAARAARKDGRRRHYHKELWVLRESYAGVSSLADILNRAFEEDRQVGASGAKFDEQVAAVRRAVLIEGCRSAGEVIEGTGLSRWVVDRALENLVAGGVLETRDCFCLSDGMWACYSRARLPPRSG